jgi:formylglycine-generating enzyme required for sulfatase activity
LKPTSGAQRPWGFSPDGRTPQGVYDLSGNVWEWTKSQFRPYPYDAADGREELDDAEARRVLRGGSWFLNRLAARAVSRYDHAPDYRNLSMSAGGWWCAGPHLIMITDLCSRRAQR